MIPKIALYTHVFRALGEQFKNRRTEKFIFTFKEKKNEIYRFNKIFWNKICYYFFNRNDEINFDFAGKGGSSGIAESVRQSLSDLVRLNPRKDPQSLLGHELYELLDSLGFRIPYLTGNNKNKK